MLNAMLFGDRTRLTQNLRVGFQRTGSFHLFVVSGMHVALLAGLVFWLARRLRLSRDLTQRQLGEQGGVARTLIQRIEAGEPVTTASLIRVLRAHDGARAARIMSEQVEATTHILGGLLPSRG